jgi:hypothetical protein
MGMLLGIERGRWRQAVVFSAELLACKAGGAVYFTGWGRRLFGWDGLGRRMPEAGGVNVKIGALMLFFGW